MAWTWYSAKACYLGTSGGEVLYQPTVMTVGQYYVVKFTISGQTQGKLVVPSLAGTHIFLEDGIHVAYGVASTTALIFLAQLDAYDNIFNGCVDIVEVTNFSQHEEFATSPCLQVQEDQGCLLLIEATNDNDALGFDWDGLTLTARVDGIFARLNHKTEMTSSLDTEGNKSIIYFDGQRGKDLLIRAAPSFIHDFLYLCMAVDGFSINGTDWVMQNDEYPQIKWNTRFLEGTVEIPIRKKIQKLNKTNC